MDYNRLTIVIFIVSVILLIAGLMVFFLPKILIKISEPLNKEIGTKKKSRNLLPTDERVFQRRHIIGPILVIVGLILLYYSYFLF